MSLIRRILSIDGGGLKGALPAAFLAEVEDVTGRRIADHFDLIAGTSTGGIIALGLGLGIPARDILRLYEERGAVIFGQSTSWERFCYRFSWLRHIFRPKHSPGELKRTLEDVLGSRQLGDSTTRLLIPAFDPVRRRVAVFKTSHHERLTTDWRRSAVDVALATAAAPTYFPAHVMVNRVSLVDGGIWANNPAGLAAVEAATVLGWERSSTKMLSLGCGDTAAELNPTAGARSLRRVVETMMAGQSYGAEGTAMLLLEHSHQRQAYFRVNPHLPRRLSGLDDASVVQDLIGVGRSEARESMPMLKREFFAPGGADLFTPFHGARSAAA
jgi:predicted acylesterase/phospholipase RssA